MNVPDTNVNFIWDAIPGTANYTLQVSTDSLFSSFAVNATSIATNHDSVNGILVWGNKYYWRVKADAGSFSAVGAFYYFNPANFPSLSMWLHADGQVIRDVSNKVSQWISPFAPTFDTVAQATQAKQPTYILPALGVNGRPLIRFDGVANCLIGTQNNQNIGSNNQTTFVFGRASGIAQAYYAKSKFAGVTPRYALYYNNNGVSAPSLTDVYHEPAIPAKVLNAVARIPGSYEVVSSVVDRTVNQKVYKIVNNVTSETSGNPPITGPSYNFTSPFRFVVGAYNDANDIGEVFPLNGDIGEMAFYSQTFPDSVYRMISRYMMDKYYPPVNLGPNIIVNNFCADTLRPTKLYTSYTWSTGSNAAFIVVTQPGTYSLTATDPFGRSFVDTIKVITPDPNFVGPAKICFGSSVLWNTGLDSTKFHFHWTDNSTHNYLNVTTPGTYAVTVTDSSGCTYASRPVAFTIDSFKFQIDLGPNAALCTGNLLGLQTGANLVTHYQWSTADTTPTISINSAATYRVTVTDINGCTATDSTSITIRGVGPIAAFTADTVCSNALTQFTDLSTIASPYTITRWTWTFGDSQGDTIQNPAHLYPAAGTYTATLVAESNTGCTSTPVTHQVLVRPTVQAFFLDSLACTGDSTRFFDRSTAAAGDTLVSWLWDFGGSQSILQNSKHLFAATGNDTVSLIAGTMFGCRDTFARNVTVVNTAAAPDTFGLLAPINYSNLIDAVDTFTWQASAHAVRYVLQIATNAVFSNIIYTHEVYAPYDSTSSIPFSSNTYFWRVTAYSLCGAALSSETDSFTRFNPNLVGNISFWVMADGRVTRTPANRVTQWTDNNSTTNVKQLDPVVAPLWIANVPALNNRPVLRFDGTDSLSGGDILDMHTKSRTYFMIGRSLSPTGTYFAKSALGAQPDRFAMYQSNSRLTYFHQENSNTNYALADSFIASPNFELAVGITDRQAGFVFLNRNDHQLNTRPILGNPTYDMNSRYNFLIGAYGYGNNATTGLFLNGDIAEIIAFDSVLDVATYNSVKRYLYIKYGGGPVNLGPDININYGFCGNITLNASDRYSKYAWSTGDSTKTINVSVAGTYSVTVTDIFEQVYTDTIVINKPSIALPPANTFCLGDSIIWNVNLGAGYHYLFSNGDTTPYTILRNPGSVSVTITDTIPPSQGGPCSISKTVVFNQDSFRVLATLGPDTTLCRGQYVGLRAQASQADHYLWSNSSSDSTLLVNAAGDYSVTVTSVNGCTAFDTIHADVSGQVANVSFLINPSYCIGDTVQFQNFTSIQGPFQINSYLWQFGDSITDTVASPSHYYDTTGTYQATLIVTADSGCVKSLTQTLRINPLPVAKFTHDIGCANSMVKFTDQSTATLADPIVRWHWEFGTVNDTSDAKNPLHNFLLPGRYPVSLTVYTLIGCPRTYTDTIEIYPELVAAICSENLCKGQTVQFHDCSASVSTITWTWQFPDNTYSNDSNPAKAFGLTGDYVINLIVTNAVGCVNSVTDTVTIFDSPTAVFDNPDRCVQFIYPFQSQSVAVVGDTIQSLLWQFGDSSATSIKHNPYHQYADTGAYNVTLHVTTEHGCQDSVTKPVHLIGKPHAAFAFTPNFGGAPINIQFTNLSNGGVGYNWDFGDGNSTTDVNPNHTYGQNGVYVVRLIVYNQVGCSDTTTDSVHVVPASLDLLIDTFIVSQDTDGRWNMAARIFNVGTRTVYYFDVYASLGNGNTIVERVNDTLRTGEYIVYQYRSHFVITEPTNQTYICTETKDPDGEADENPANNHKCAPLRKDIRVIAPYPNPASSTMTFGAVLPAKGDVTVTLFDALGVSLGSVYSGEAAIGVNYWNIDTQLLRSGGYFIIVKYKDDSQTIKFVVSH